jgi:hypothetical protein
VLWLIKLWLQAPAEERDGDGKRRMSGGRSSKRGTPQGGVVSPLLSVIYMNRFLKHWCLTGRGEAFHAHVISYADDFVILSRGHAEEAMAWTKAVMTKLGLALTETKASVKDARRDSFDFLGSTLRPRHFPNVGRWYLGATPSTAPINIARLLAGPEPSIGAIGRSKAIAIMPKIRLLASARPKLSTEQKTKLGVCKSPPSHRQSRCLSAARSRRSPLLPMDAGSSRMSN